MAGGLKQKIGQAAAAGGIAPVAHTPTRAEQSRLAAPYWSHRCSVCGPMPQARTLPEALLFRDAHWHMIKWRAERWG